MKIELHLESDDLLVIISALEYAYQEKTRIAGKHHPLMSDEEANVIEKESLKYKNLADDLKKLKTKKTAK